MTPAEYIISKFGGTRPMAEKTGWKPTTIQSWKTAGHIPAKRQQAVLDHAKRLSIDVAPADFFGTPAGSAAE